MDRAYGTYGFYVILQPHNKLWGYSMQRAHGTWLGYRVNV